MTEATGYEAQTIHRMLELSGGPEDQVGSHFERNEQNPLESDVIIIERNVHGRYSSDECPFKSHHAGNASHYGGGRESASIGWTGERIERYYPVPLF